jgi:hypothetical protein
VGRSAKPGVGTTGDRGEKQRNNGNTPVTGQYGNSGEHDNDRCVGLKSAGCQREIVSKIREKGVQYVLSVKENQGETYREIKEYFDDVKEA